MHNIIIISRRWVSPVEGSIHYGSTVIRSHGAWASMLYGSICHCRHCKNGFPYRECVPRAVLLGLFIISYTIYEDWFDDWYSTIKQLVQKCAEKSRSMKKLLLQRDDFLIKIWLFISFNLVQLLLDR